jgi:hypothetical protein
MRRAIVQELSQLPRRMGGTTGVLICAFALLALGILLPWHLSFDFLDAMILLAYACLPALLVAPVVAESFAGDRERAQIPTAVEERRQLLYAKVAAGALYGWSSALLALVMGIATVSLSFTRWILPPALLAIDLALVSLAVSVSAASISAGVSVRARSAKYAKRTLRQGFLLLLVLVIYYSRFMPVEWKRHVMVPGDVSGFTEFVVVISVTLLGLSGCLLKLASTRTEDTEIRLNL